MSNQNLTKAKVGKKDEFYTQYEDIEKEVSAYFEYDNDIFRDKTVLLPADNPFKSNFFKYFALHFRDYGLKRLIATNYDLNPTINQQLSLFGNDEPEEKETKAYKAELTNDFSREEVPTIKDVDDFLLLEQVKLSNTGSSSVLSYLHGDSDFEPGDFRSKEVTELKNQSDLIITNPPFSLFRDIVKWIDPYKKKFLILGTANAVSYKEIFPLIQHNIIHLGVNNGAMNFKVSDNYKPQKHRFWIDETGQKWQRLGNIEWYTNLEHGKQHQLLHLRTMQENMQNSPHKRIRGKLYAKYNNYNAIEVPFVDAIPVDYKGTMGVPVTFLDKYNPEQFEIVKFRKGDDNKDLNYTVDGQPVYPYFRILIRAKR